MPCLLFHITKISWPHCKISSESFLLSASGSQKSLCGKHEGMQGTKKGDIEGARKAVSMIVGRDTSVLDKAGITRQR